MSALRGLAAGVLGLSALEVFVTSSSAQTSTSALIKIATGTISRLVDPSLPLIPDRR